jgi:hypothetical protein
MTTRRRRALNEVWGSEWRSRDGGIKKHCFTSNSSSSSSSSSSKKRNQHINNNINTPETPPLFLSLHSFVVQRHDHSVKRGGGS